MVIATAACVCNGVYERSGPALKAPTDVIVEMAAAFTVPVEVLAEIWIDETPCLSHLRGS